jgi:hypothetical protein
MTVVRRAVTLVAALVILLTGVAGCGADPDGDDEGDEQVQVEATEAALEALAEELTARPGIAEAEATYDRSTGLPIPSQLYVVAVVDTEDPEQVRRTVEDVARATWESDVPTIATLIVEAVSADDRLAADTADVFSALSVDRAELTERFGPRGG